jgi:hypothetical protein
MIVEVFKTNIRHYYQSQSLMKKLLEYFPAALLILIWKIVIMCCVLKVMAFAL